MIGLVVLCPIDGCKIKCYASKIDDSLDRLYFRDASEKEETKFRLSEFSVSMLHDLESKFSPCSQSIMGTTIED